MQDSSIATRKPLSVDIPVDEAYLWLVTKDTIMSSPKRTNSTDAAFSGHRAIPLEPEETSVGALDPRTEHVGHGLSAYSQARFVAAVTGELPLDDYAREVSEHIEKQLPRHRHSARVLPQ
jgi:hypothetical protein